MLYSVNVPILQVNDQSTISYSTTFDLRWMLILFSVHSLKPVPPTQHAHTFRTHTPTAALLGPIRRLRDNRVVTLARHYGAHVR